MLRQRTEKRGESETNKKGIQRECDGGKVIWVFNQDSINYCCWCGNSYYKNLFRNEYMWTNAINMQPVASTTNKRFWDNQVYHFHLRCKVSPPLMSDYHLHVIVDSVTVCCQLKEDICGQPVWTLVHMIMSTTSVCWRSPTHHWSHKHAGRQKKQTRQHQ